MLATYLIGLREGLEATLVVSILIAFLVKSGRKDRLVQVWSGVGLAVALSVFFGWLLSYTTTTLLQKYEHRELFEAVTSILAVCFVTWMIFWMRRAARSIAVAVMAFLAVVREGLETSLIFYSAVQGASSNTGPLFALLGGIASAVAIGWIMYATAVRINLSVFFTWTGALLILVAAGILKYGVHDFQEAGTLPGLNNLAYDISGVLHPDAWYTALLSGMFNLTPTASVLETLAWVAYGLPVLVIFLWPARAASRPASSQAAPSRPAPSAGPEAAAPAPAPASVSETPAPAPAPQQ